MCIRYISLILFLFILISLNTCEKESQRAPEHQALKSDYAPIKLEKIQADTAGRGQKIKTFKEKLEKSFIKNQDINTTIQAILELAPLAQSLNMTSHLIYEIRDQYSSEFFTKISKEKKQRALKKLVNEGVQEQDPDRRNLYHEIIYYLFQYHDYSEYWYAYCNENKVRPGQEVSVAVYNYRYYEDKLSKKSYNLFFQVSKLELDENLKPQAFKIIRQDTLYQITDYQQVLSESLKEPGIYRLTVYNDKNFSDFYVQATLLDLITKRTPEQLLVWVSSYKDSLKGPYDLVLLYGQDKHIKVKSKDNGTAYFIIEAEPEASADIQVAAATGGHYAFSSNRMYWDYVDRIDQQAYIYFDRPIYRPGQKVHLKGIFRSVLPNGSLTPTYLDSITVTINNPNYEEIYRSTLGVDEFGQFGDSLNLADDAKHGNYRVEISNPHVPGSGKDQQAISLLETYFSGFIVEAYKKPEFKISVTPQNKWVLINEKAAFDIKGEYYFGAPLANLEITLRWYTQNMQHYFPWWTGRQSKAYFYPSGDKTLLKEEKIKLDAAGKAVAKYQTKNIQDYGFLILEARATDASRRLVSSEAQVKCVKYDVYLNLSTDKWIYNLGDSVKVTVSAFTMDEKPYQGKCKLSLKKGRSIESEKELTLDKNGMTRDGFMPKDSGKYTLKAEIMDSRERTVVVTREFNVQEKKTITWDWEQVTLKTDKEKYAIGDTVKITIDTGADNVRSLFTVEGGYLKNYGLETIKAHTADYYYVIPREQGTNFYIGAAFSGRTNMVYQNIRVVVVDSSLILNLQLAGPEQLKPGDTYEGEITLTDQQGRPVAGCFSLALVDESIFDVASKSTYRRSSDGYGLLSDIFGVSASEPEEKEILIWDHFTSRLYNKVQNNISDFDQMYLSQLDKMGKALAEPEVHNFTESREEEIEVRAEKRSRMKAEVAGQGVLAYLSAGGKGEDAIALDDVLGSIAGLAPAEKKPAPRERKEFRDLGYWVANVKTSGNGRASIKFRMPDDLTQWRFTMIGGDKEARLIQHKQSVQTKQNLMVKLQAPRSFVVGDSCFITAVVHNYTEQDQVVDILLKLNNENAELLSSAKQNFTIQKNGTDRIDWAVRILKPEEATFSAVLTTGTGGDMETRTYPVLVHGILQTRAKSGMIQEQDTINLSFPENSDPLSRKIRIDYAPTLAYSLFSGLEYLTGYPYGCVEQTMSRFLPNLYVDQALQKLNMQDDSLHTLILKYTEKGVERLTQLQNHNGSWGWWGSSGSGDGRMTAYVISGLSYAKQHDYKINNESYQQGIRALQDMVSKFAKEHNTLSQMIYALYLTKIPLSGNETNWVNMLYDGRSNLSVQSLAYLLEILDGSGKKDQVATIEKLLLSKAQISGSHVYWSGDQSYWWHNQDIETTAGVLYALLKINTNFKELPGIVNYLSIKRTRGYWVSTKTTAKVIRALALYLEQTGETDPDFQGTILANNRALKSFKVTKKDLNNWQGRIEYMADKKDYQFVLKKSGKGVLYYTVSLLYTLKECPIIARGEQLTVQRKFTRLVYTMKKNGDWIVERKSFNGAIKRGEELEVHVTLNANGRFEHLVLEDFFPQGMEVEKKSQDYYNLWCRWWFWDYTHSEARDDRMVFFLDNVQKGKHTFTYILRAETPGRFHALPAVAQLMYNPEIQGNSQEDIITITE
jgi:uncharacterized protein YfaS (alpha-2-macroglobulin family)